MSDTVVEKNKVDLKQIYTSLFVCVVIPLVLALVVGHISGYYSGFSFLGTSITIPSTLFSVLTPVMFAVFGLGLHFLILSARSTILNFKLSLSLWVATFLFSLSFIVIFFSSHMLVLSFVWMAITLSMACMQTVVCFRMNIISAICSLLFSGWLAVITYVLTMALVV